MRMTWIKTACWTGCVLALFGCAHQTVNTYETAFPEAAIRLIGHKQILTDSRLSSCLYLKEIREGMTAQGYKQIQVFLKSAARFPVGLVYRFEWYDHQGMRVALPDEEMWKSATVVGGDDLTLSTIAPDLRCADFKLRLKQTN